MFPEFNLDDEADKKSKKKGTSKPQMKNTNNSMECEQIPEEIAEDHKRAFSLESPPHKFQRPSSLYSDPGTKWIGPDSSPIFIFSNLSNVISILGASIFFVVIMVSFATLCSHYSTLNACMEPLLAAA